MRKATVFMLISLLSAGPLLAQEPGGSNPAGECPEGRVPLTISLFWQRLIGADGQPLPAPQRLAIPGATVLLNVQGIEGPDQSVSDGQGNAHFCVPLQLNGVDVSATGRINDPVVGILSLRGALPPFNIGNTPPAPMSLEMLVDAPPINQNSCLPPPGVN